MQLLPKGKHASWEWDQDLFHNIILKIIPWHLIVIATAQVGQSKCLIVQVRYYDKKFEEEDEMFDDEMDLDGCEMDEVELRS